MRLHFSFASTPRILFGPGRREVLPELLAVHGKRVLLVTGDASFDASGCRDELLDALASAGFEVTRLRVVGEPSPALVDDAVREMRPFHADVVLAVGGGSCIDAAKAIAGLLPLGHSVLDYLEGVGKGETYPGPSLPFVAVPTTAGTGGETSKNAVLSERGEGGFKKSFRDERLVARAVIIDPELSLGCPPDVTAACGMDAFTQLLESYVSTDASPVTDALALSGLRHVRDCLPHAVARGVDLEARGGMAFAATLSGLTLANAGLGAVHGLASPLGAFFPAPHGAVCGTLVAAATSANLAAMREREPENPALVRYAEVGRLFADDASLGDEAARSALLEQLDCWTEEFAMPRLSAFGVTSGDVDRIVAHISGHSMRTNPIRLENDELAAIVRARM